MHPSVYLSVCPSICPCPPLGWLAGWASDLAGWASGLAGWASGLAGWPRGGDGQTDKRTNRKSLHSTELRPLLGPLPKKQGKGIGDHSMPFSDWFICFSVCLYAPCPLSFIQPGMKPSQSGLRPSLRPSKPVPRPSHPGQRPGQPGFRPSQPGLASLASLARQNCATIGRVFSLFWAAAPIGDEVL